MAVPPPTTKIFSIKPLRWRDKENPAFIRRHPAFAQADLLPELAKRAIALGAAVLIDHPQVRVLSRGNAPKHAPLAECVAIDGGDEIEVREDKPFDEQRILHSAFAERPGPFLKPART
jgi:hypothetical protein